MAAQADAATGSVVYADAVAAAGEGHHPSGMVDIPLGAATGQRCSPILPLQDALVLPDNGMFRQLRIFSYSLESSTPWAGKTPGLTSHSPLADVRKIRACFKACQT